MDNRRLTQTAPASGVARPRTGGKVFVERENVLDDIIEDAKASSQGQRRYIRTKVIEEPVLSDTRRSPQNNNSPPVDLKRAKNDSNPHAEAVAAMKEKRERQFPHILAAVDRANSFLDEVDKEMSLAEEAKRNKIRRQFEDWNTHVHGEIQVCRTVLRCLFASWWLYLVALCDVYLETNPNSGW